MRSNFRSLSLNAHRRRWITWRATNSREMDFRRCTGWAKLPAEMCTHFEPRKLILQNTIMLERSAPIRRELPPPPQSLPWRPKNSNKGSLIRGTAQLDNENHWGAQIWNTLKKWRAKRTREMVRMSWISKYKLLIVCLQKDNFLDASVDSYYLESNLRLDGRPSRRQTFPTGQPATAELVSWTAATILAKIYRVWKTSSRVVIILVPSLYSR